MKLDVSGLESSPSSNLALLGGSDDADIGFSIASPSFQLPQVSSDFDGFQKKAVQMVKPAKGTTTLAFIFKDGVMVAADSRASMGGYISSQSVKKIIEINPYMLGTMAGGAADCQFWHRNLGIKFSRSVTNLGNLETDQSVYIIVQPGWDYQMQRSLHAAAYYLNPRFHYSNDFKTHASNAKIGLYAVLDKFITDPNEKTSIDLELDQFRYREGLFGRPEAERTIFRRSPASWWSAYGDSTPNLTNFAIRVLSLTCSSSGCERNWSTFNQCRLHELANKRRISVTGASKLLANILYSYRGMGLSVGTMIAGWDETGPGLYYVDSEGGRLKGTRFSVGSGSPYAYGVLDNGYKYDMSVEETAELARRAIYHATFRDGASGGVASVYHVGPEGWNKLSGDDVGELYYQYNPVIPTKVEQEGAEAMVVQ